MPRLSTPKLPQLQALNELMTYSARAPKREGQRPQDLLRAYRSALRMSQKELARRAGLTQSHVARLESGAVDAQWGTWKRLFDAMACDLLLVPRPRKRPHDLLAEARLDAPPGSWPPRRRARRYDD
ncbi:MAG: helix-turn-helix domain-containing protein [Elusimicrobiota bacterium]|nr:helix-turn-helix domain-containing protein [Elusimicrobiota bacterium]